MNKLLLLRRAETTLKNFPQKVVLNLSARYELRGGGMGDSTNSQIEEGCVLLRTSSPNKLRRGAFYVAPAVKVPLSPTAAVLSDFALVWKEVGRDDLRGASLRAAIEDLYRFPILVV